jgi:rhodanese-related sulfurtransferase
MKMTGKDFKGVVILVSAAVITGLVFNYFSPSGIMLSGKWDPSQGVVDPVSRTGSLDSSIEINNPEIVKNIVEKKLRLVLDARPEFIYNQGHLPSAMSFPLVDFDERIAGFMHSVDRKQPILVYCSGPECTDSHTVAERLIHLGYENVRVFSGGFRQWQDRGYEIQENEKE